MSVSVSVSANVCGLAEIRRWWGLDPGESECSDAAAERVESGTGTCDDIVMVVGVVT